MIEAMVDFTGGVGRTFDLQVIHEIDLSFQLILFAISVHAY